MSKSVLQLIRIPSQRARGRFYLHVHFFSLERRKRSGFIKYKFFKNVENFTYFVRTVVKQIYSCKEIKTVEKLATIQFKKLSRLVFKT